MKFYLAIHRRASKTDICDHQFHIRDLPHSAGFK
jgi:hypothetical protein